jgi:hypothetical protein
MQSLCEPEMSKHEEKNRCWGGWSVALELSEQQYAGCLSEAKPGVDRYELRILPVRGEVEGHGNAGSR